MAVVHRLHQYMMHRDRVVLGDGREGRIVRVDRSFPNGPTMVSVWVTSAKGPGLARVKPTEIVGPADLDAPDSVRSA